MANNNYKLIFPQCECCGASGVVVKNHRKLVVSFELPCQPSGDKRIELRRAIADDKPPSAIRNIVTRWVRELTISEGRG